MEKVDIMGKKTIIEKVWITKKALTGAGVFSIANVEQFSKYPNMVNEKLKGGYTSYYHKPDWHLTEEEALDQARKMVEKEITKLEKKINLLKNKKY